MSGSMAKIDFDVEKIEAIKSLSGMPWKLLGSPPQGDVLDRVAKHILGETICTAKPLLVSFLTNDWVIHRKKLFI